MLQSCAPRVPPVYYRFSLNIERSGSLYSGSSVVEVRPSTSDSIDGKFYEAHLRGVATFVSMPDGSEVAALLGQWGRDHFQEPIAYLRGGVGPVNLDLRKRPSIVVFDRPDDPTSYRLIEADGRDYSTPDGPRVTDAFVELTSGPPTSAVPASMIWLSKLPNDASNIVDGTNLYPAGRFTIVKSQLESGEN